MLEIKNLHASIDDTKILKGLNLNVNAGEVHAIMGPNGSGKSTLASVIAGREDYEVTDGEINFSGNELSDLGPDERAREGIKRRIVIERKVNFCNLLFFSINDL